MRAPSREQAHVWREWTRKHYQRWTYAHVREYLSFCRSAFAIVRGGGRVRVNWSGEPLDLAGFRREFRAALDKRITCKGLLPRGRKWDCDYQRGMMQDAQRLNTPRLIIDGFNTPELYRRFASRLRDAAERAA